MTLFILEDSPLNLRGELTKWLLEVKPGVFVGKLSKTVRDLLWDKITNNYKLYGALMIYSFNNEQGFKFEMYGEPTRSVVDYDGLELIGRSLI